MQMRKIPNTQMSVSSLCLGTMTFGTPVAESEAIYLTNAAIDRGINFIDTANMYEGYTRFVGSAGGVAEEILGKALKGKRDRVVLATKVGMKIGPNDDDQGLSRKHLLSEIDRSLARLQTNYVDLYYLHKPDPNTAMEDTIQAMVELISAGKVKEWAVSNFTAEQLENLLQICDQGGWKRPVAVQPAYSYFKRDIEKDLLPLCEREQIAVIPYQVLQGGLLTGKYKRDSEIPAGSRMLEKPEWVMALSGPILEQLEKCESEAAKLERTMMQHALLTLLEQKSVVSLIVGLKNLAQLDALVAAVK
jgi:aryl-alcohol dehydrogenase-like predicted oxidoreductase